MSDVLALRILENSEIMGKTQKRMGGDPDQSLFQKKVGTSVQKLHKNRKQIFSSCPALLDFLTLLN